MRRLTAARSEFAAAHSRKVDFATAHSRLTICIAPSLNPDRSAIPQKSATLSKVGICSGSQPQGRNNPAHFRPPSTQLKPISIFLKGEFEAAHSRKVGICSGSQPQGRFCYGSQPPDNLHSTIAKPRPFRYPSKIRNVIKGRNLQRLTAARSEFATPHGYYYKQKAPSLNPDRSAIPQKSATLSKVGTVSGDPPLTVVRLSCR